LRFLALLEATPASKLKKPESSLAAAAEEPAKSSSRRGAA
jgi:hypothetical protein